MKDPGAEILGGDDLPEAAIDPNAPQIRVSHEYSNSQIQNISDGKIRFEYFLINLLSYVILR